MLQQGFISDEARERVDHLKIAVECFPVYQRPLVCNLSLDFNINNNPITGPGNRNR